MIKKSTLFLICKLYVEYSTENTHSEQEIELYFVTIESNVVFNLFYCGMNLYNFLSCFFLKLT